MPQALTVLEIGCSTGRLGRSYKSEHPHSHWTSLGQGLSDLDSAAHDLDHTIPIDPEALEVEDFAEKYDLILFHGVQERAAAPRKLLLNLRQLVTDDGRLVCCIANANNISTLNRLLIGDLTDDEATDLQTNR